MNEGMYYLLLAPPNLELCVSSRMRSSEKNMSILCILKALVAWVILMLVSSTFSALLCAAFFGRLRRLICRKTAPRMKFFLALPNE
jgi:hypothetical protein